MLIKKQVQKQSIHAVHKYDEYDANLVFWQPMQIVSPNIILKNPLSIIQSVTSTNFETGSFHLMETQLS